MTKSVLADAPGLGSRASEREAEDHPERRETLLTADYSETHEAQADLAFLVTNASARALQVWVAATMLADAGERVTRKRLAEVCRCTATTVRTSVNELAELGAVGISGVAKTGTLRVVRGFGCGQPADSSTTFEQGYPRFPQVVNSSGGDGLEPGELMIPGMERSEMQGIDAGPHPTEVMHMEPVGDLADERLVAGSMSANGDVPATDRAIAAEGITSPDPAAGLVNNRPDEDQPARRLDGVHPDGGSISDTGRYPQENDPSMTTTSFGETLRVSPGEVSNIGTPRKRDIVFDTIAEVTGAHPSSEGGRIARAKKQIVAFVLEERPGASDPEIAVEIDRRAKLYHHVLPRGALLTPTALASWWHRLDNAQTNGTTEDDLEMIAYAIDRGRR